MLFRFHGQCLDCSHEWDGLRRRIACGCIDFHEPATYCSYRCGRCLIELCVPRQLSRSAWLRWVSQNASELTKSPLDFTASELGVRVDVQSLDVISRSPLLFQVCERVSNILAGTRSRYVPVPIHIPTVECPDCGDPMTAGDQRAGFVVCPECNNPVAESTSEQHAGIVLIDYFPLADEDIRRVILHLEQLAEPLKDRGAKRVLALPAFEGNAPLWDRQLDG
jgi:hypothetical protein